MPAIYNKLWKLLIDGNMKKYILYVAVSADRQSINSD
jgi:hypothetical protein